MKKVKKSTKKNIQDKKILNSIKLKVQQAKKRDIGRNIVRVDAEVMQKLKVQTGDIVSLYGKKESVGIVWPGYGRDIYLGIARIDSRLQKNTGTRVNDTIEIRKVEAKIAQNIVLAPLDIQIRNNPRFESFVKRKLNNFPVTFDDYINISIGISREARFRIIDLKPKGVCIIKHNTILNISEEVIKGVEYRIEYITYDDIGGLGNEIDEIRTILHLNLRHDLITEKVNIEIPKGILFEGPSGTGKTLLARAIITENMHYNIISIIAPEIVQKHYGEAEKELREIFKRAQIRAPSIIFIDHIDSIAPKIQKEMIDKAAFVEHRIVAQLLGLMDSLHSYKDVIIIGITHKLDLIEPALLRPGRFDKIIHFPLPDYHSRIKIYEIHTRNLQLDFDVSLEDIAKQSDKFTGAEIKGACQLATLNAIKRHIPDLRVRPDEISDDMINNIKLNTQDFLNAIREIAERSNSTS